jgi:D-alanine-D-alanine ligase
MDKAAAKAVFAHAGLPVAPHRIIDINELTDHDPLPPPYVVKPVNEGSSVGVSIVKPGDNRNAQIAAAWSFGPAMVEQYIPGRELTVCVLEDRALAVTEILTDEEFYDYNAKYSAGGSRHVIPAEIPPEITHRAMDIALAAHRALGCRGASRADLRYDDATGRLVLLEVNTQPGLTPTSLLPEQAAYIGMDFPALCAWMVERAQCRV